MTWDRNAQSEQERTSSAETWKEREVGKERVNQCNGDFESIKRHHEG